MSTSLTKIPSYQLTVTGDYSGDGLFDFLVEVQAAGCPWHLRYFEADKCVGEDDYLEWQERDAALKALLEGGV